MPDRLQAELLEAVAEIRAFLQDQQRLGIDALPLPPIGPVPVPPPAAATDACVTCALSEARKQRVAGSGPAPANLCCLVLAPSRADAEQGELLSGDAGRLFDALLFALGFDRSQVYLTSLVKCPLPSRPPAPAELAACAPCLQRELEQVRPRWLLALGEPVAAALLGADGDRGRGKLLQYQGTPLLCTRHPAELLKEPALKREVWEDFGLLLRTLREA